MSVTAIGFGSVFLSECDRDIYCAFWSFHPPNEFELICHSHSHSPSFKIHFFPRFFFEFIAQKVFCIIHIPGMWQIRKCRFTEKKQGKYRNTASPESGENRSNLTNLTWQKKNKQNCYELWNGMNYFRSLNNLLERFHQSFFFYLLSSTTRSATVFTVKAGLVRVKLILSPIELMYRVV